MEIKIVKDQPNKLLDRREVSFEIKHTGQTPSRKDIRAQLAAKLTVDEKLVVVQPMTPVYGVPFIKGNANIYKKEDFMKKIETAPMIKRNNPEEVKKEGEAAAPAPKPEVKEQAKKESAPKTPKEGAK